MYYLNPEWILKATRDQRNLEQDWSELRAWVQEHQSFLRMAGIARSAGLSPEVASALLLRDAHASRLRRDWDRLDGLLLIFMGPPFGYVPSWLQLK
ncbi:hypothetical protein SAMN06265337_1227 [Hymenobacter gelipurpurascens]|uniref:Uncharacterized protein n=1 Tax=Hymenobacter gelipurpurascens TaxID=89968 RepID=A0A212TGJ6_9BACT|nr:hypothetical protein [Hymenobacter gelipurpurascens]SNC65159.1 hypothetical protein SAMN06265337_1227 [Hymenobacter gelipurpurascens]